MPRLYGGIKRLTAASAPVFQRLANCRGNWPCSRRWGDIVQRWASAGGDFHPVALSYTWLVIRRRERRAALRDWNDSTSLRLRWNFNALKPESRAQCDTGSETCTALCRYTHALGYKTTKKKNNNWQTHQTLNISMCLEPKTSALHWILALLERLRNVKLRERTQRIKLVFPNWCSYSPELLARHKTLSRRFP